LMIGAEIEEVGLFWLFFK